MPLSRLDNFLKNVRGNVIYVNPNDLDATDAVENQGNSLGRPFITIQRALIEAARFSYQQGLDNDRFGKTSIVLYPGEHDVDNRPGWLPDNSTDPIRYRLRSGTTSSDFPALSTTSNFDLASPNNILYKVNSIYGGVIVPRGVSIVGMDVRKTKIRPLYVPNPDNTNIERSAIFRMTGGSYFWQFSILDGNPNGKVYKDYTEAQFIPNFTHHKLTSFEFVDGVNYIDLKDIFNTYYTPRTDLDVYYEKIGLLYGSASGRAVEPDYPSSGLDIQPKIDEYRIIGPKSGEVNISKIIAGDGSTTSDIITVDISTGLAGLDVDTAFNVSGVPDAAYNGSFTVNQVLYQNSSGLTTSFKYVVPVNPVNAAPTVSASKVVLDTNTVESSSPYIFNVDMSSVLGLNGLHADGSKVSGFKSIIVQNFKGIGLQKDNNAFVKYNATTGSYDDSTTISNIHNDGNAKYKPAYYNYHIKASNNALVEIDSTEAAGFAQQFVTETGGEFTLTNSNSSYGQNALISKGFRSDSFLRDDVGYITNIIPPKENVDANINLEYGAIDVGLTTAGAGAGTTSKLYLYQETNLSDPPESVIQGYRFGAKNNDKLNTLITQEGASVEYFARIVMPNTGLGSTQVSSVKKEIVGRNVSTGNSITDSTLTLTKGHQFINAESIRIVSDNARLPDGIDANRIYYAITTNLAGDQIKIATSANDAVDAKALTINNLGGTLTVESRVSDKLAGEVGHPIQYDTTNSNWYVNVGTAATDNTLAPTIISLDTANLGDATPRTFVTRKPDSRTLSDKIYKYRYVIPAGSGITSARAPKSSFVVQESNDVTGLNNTEVALQFSPTSVTMTNETEMRNFSFLRTCTYVSSGVVTYDTELPHGLSVGSRVKILNVTSAENTTGIGNSGYNGTFTVSDVTGLTQFKVNDGPTTDPDQFSNNVSTRTTALPTYQRVNTSNNFYIYNIDEIREYVSGEQDGVYYFTAVDASSTPAVTPFTDKSKFSFSQPIKDLYPQYDRDNPNSNPSATQTYALPDKTGEVVVDEVKNSITKQGVDRAYYDLGVGVAITDIQSDQVGVAHTVFTTYDHGLNRVTQFGVVSGGVGYGVNSGATEYYYNATVRKVGIQTYIDNTTSTKWQPFGVNATCRVTVNSSRVITGAEVMNGGTNYREGDLLWLDQECVPHAETAVGFTTAILEVTKIYDNVGDTVSIAGITSTNYGDYNQLYRITGISTQTGTKEFIVDSRVGVTDGAVHHETGVGVTDTANGYAQVTGEGLTISAIDYTNTLGIATITTSTAHGLRPNNTIFVGGATNSFWNAGFVVTEVVSLTKAVLNVGVSTLSPGVAGTVRGYYPGLSAQGGNVTLYDENFGGRQQNIYGGITDTLSSAMSASTDEVNTTSIASVDWKIGDYLRIDDEIMRIKSTVSGNPLKVFRGLLGTQAAAHVNGSVIRQLIVEPVELRKPSSTRATSHTFEYVGYGPGNYSTALPSRQDTSPSFDEQLLAQSFTCGGGVNVYTGMNDSGDFFVGNKKIDATTGKEEVFDTPVPTVTGEDLFSAGAASGVDIITPLEVTVSRSIKVEGGANDDILSQFDGPVSFSKKVTSSSDEGIEANSIFLQGDATVSRKYTVGISTPVTSGNPGDIVWQDNPPRGGTTGWVFTTNNDWAPFGAISASALINEANFDRIGIATTACGTDETLRVGSGSSTFVIENGAVGIGSTANGAKLRVDGLLYANTIEGDGSGLFNLAVDSLWTLYDSALHPSAQGNGVSPTIGIGSTTAGRSNITLNLDGTNNANVGAGGTDLHVVNTSKFLRQSEFTGGINLDNDLGIGVSSAGHKLHVLTADNAGALLESTDATSLIAFKDNSTTNNVQLGAVTDDLIIKTGGSERVRLSSAGKVGIATATPRATLDVEGETRLKTYTELPVPVGSSSGIVNLDLSAGQTFTVTTTEDITEFRCTNFTSSMATAFTIKLVQGTTARNVGIDTFKTSAGVVIPVYWPGGIEPTVTKTADAIDVYSFMTFDGGSSLFGVVGGQNFS